MSLDSTAESVRAIALDEITVSESGSQGERRRHFDKAAIAELAESIRTVGLLSPIIIRPVGEEIRDGYQLVAGERRFLAAKQAGLKTISATVRKLSDEQVLEIQLVENLQREGLHELAEAEGYEGLQKLGYSAEEIAGKVGKSKAYVYARMKLCTLSKAARKAFYDGKLTASTALLLARIPVDSLQDEALKAITEDSWDDGVMPFREASEHIRQEYMTRLSDGGFPTEDANLVPAAGPCGACPKRTGNQKELFGDVKGADVCTDPVCFKAKRTAHAERVLAQAKAAGKKVITGPPAKKIIPHGAHHIAGGYVSLDTKCYEDSKNRTYRQILGNAFEPELVQDPTTGAVIEIAPRATANKAAGIRAPSSSSSGTQAAAEKKAKLERNFRQELFLKVRAAYPSSLTREDWNDLAIAMCREMQQETCKHLFSLWKWEPTKEKWGGGNYRKAAAAYIQKLSGAEMSRFLFDCIFVSDLSVSTWSDEKPQKLFDAAKRFKVNVEQLRRTLNAAQIPKAKKAARKAK